MVQRYKVFLDVRSETEPLILVYNPFTRSARLYGQFSLDKPYKRASLYLECESLQHRPLMLEHVVGEEAAHVGGVDSLHHKSDHDCAVVAW